MEKNLRNVLVLALGLTTTIASAQWSADSRTRINNTDSETRTAEQRITLGGDFGGIHASYDILYGVNGTDVASHSVYEAYASTDLMGFGTLTAGRKDLSYGSGALMSSNDWGNTRYTTDGIALGLSLGGLNIDVGTMGGVRNDLGNYMNASGNFGGANVNVLMMNNADGESAHGYDLSYAMGDFTIGASMNSDYKEQEMSSFGISYSGIDNLTISMSRTTYGEATGEDIAGSGAIAAAGDTLGFTYNEFGVASGYDIQGAVFGDSVVIGQDSLGNDILAQGDQLNVEAVAAIAGSTNNGGFSMANTAMSGGWANGVLGYQGANDEVTTLGIAYDLGDITLSYTMHTISNDTDADGDGVADAEDREANELRLGYALNDNASLNIARFTDGEDEWNWFTISIGM